jgi:hypothetical protein
MRALSTAMGLGKDITLVAVFHAGSVYVLVLSLSLSTVLSDNRALVRTLGV